MILDHVQDRVWCLHPRKLEEIAAFIESRLAGAPAPELAARPAAPETARYEVRDRVAIVPVYGTLAKRANMFTNWSGGTSYELLRRDLREAAQDPGVDALVLDIDSPGGVADGIAETADFVAAMPKPVVAYANGLACSAAYSLAAATEEIVASKEAEVGSIGVALTHYDRSAADQTAGIKRTHITAGKYKRVGSDAGPLNDEGACYLQELVDDTYALFVEDVARHRGMTPEAVAATEARIYTAAKARKAGLVDTIGTLDDAIRIARGASKMNEETINAARTAGIAEGRALAAAEAQSTCDLMVDAARTAERERVSRLVTLAGGAHPELLAAALSEGTEPGAFAEAILETERTSVASRLDRVASGLAPSAEASAQASGDGPPTDFLAAVAAHKKKAGCTQAEAIRAVRKEAPDLAEAYSASLRDVAA